MLINIGPQHPATHGVLRLVLELDGETVLQVHSAHRLPALELREARRIPHLEPDHPADRPHGLPGAADLQLRVRDGGREADGHRGDGALQGRRVICMELDRIFSHLLWIGTTAIDIGAFTVFLWTFQEREKIYTLHEKLTGARITTSATRIGGMMADLPVGWIDALRHFIDTTAEDARRSRDAADEQQPVDRPQPETSA